MTVLSEADPYSHTRCLGRHLWYCGMHKSNSLWGDTPLLAEGTIKRHFFENQSLTIN